MPKVHLGVACRHPGCRKEYYVEYADHHHGSGRTRAAACLGGRENVSEVQHDGARLKVAIRQYDAVDEKKIRSAQVGGVLRPGKNAVQIIIGPSVEPVENELHKLLGM